MTYASEREFNLHRRGELREQLLLGVREGLRALPNPETGEPFTEDEIRRATMKGSRFWRDFDATDVVLLGEQKRLEFLVQQIRIDRAGSAFLRGYHGPLWGEEYLPAFGGSGSVLATGNAGVTWNGSTEIPDAAAIWGRDPAGHRYQVYLSGTADDDGQAVLTLVAIDGGDETNVDVGTVITWANAPLGSAATAVVTGGRFGGGLDEETDADFARRLADRVRHKPASGNWAHIRSVARKASVSVEDAFTYACAFHAGSTLVVPVQKRGIGIGPLARIPSIGVLGAVTAAVVPPASNNLPGAQFVVVVPPVAQPSHVVARIWQPFDSTAGWTDPEPWPRYTEGTAVAISSVTTQTDFELTATTGLLPDGESSSSDVHLMVWDVSTSAFEALAIELVTALGDGVYRVELGAAPAHTLAIGDWVSPDMTRRATLAAAVSAYFDSLGPGEVVDLATDDRGGRAFRNPQPSESYPARAGQGIITTLLDAMGSPVSDAALEVMSSNLPAVPSDPIVGPSLLVLGKFAIYAL